VFSFYFVWQRMDCGLKAAKIQYPIFCSEWIGATFCMSAFCFFTNMLYCDQESAFDQSATG
jgi:hypothetical protein